MRCGWRLLVWATVMPTVSAFDWGDFHKLAVVFSTLISSFLILGAIAALVYFACVRSWFLNFKDRVRETHRSRHPWPPNSPNYFKQRAHNEQKRSSSVASMEQRLPEKHPPGLLQETPILQELHPRVYEVSDRRPLHVIVQPTSPVTVNYTQSSPTRFAVGCSPARSTLLSTPFFDNRAPYLVPASSEDLAQARQLQSITTVRTTTTTRRKEALRSISGSAV